tara:strand:- start:5211 stop:5534 length:324 start_codon:yes stop_codon:yes gene_type:complete
LFLCILCFQGPIYAQGGTDTDIDSRAVPPKVKVFPNPATNVVNILGLDNTHRTDINITDISGNVVQAHRWEVRNNALTIPVPTLSPGIYMVTIQYGERQVKVKFYKN